MIIPLFIFSFINSSSLILPFSATRVPVRHFLTEIGSLEPLDSPQIIAKTKETFKLSDLYLLESRLQSQVRGCKPTKLLSSDKNTGSYLLEIDKGLIQNKSQKLIPSCFDRLDWMGEVLAFGSSGRELIGNLMNMTLQIDDFSLEYKRVGSLLTKKDYASKAILSRVAQCINGEVSLIPKNSKYQLLLVELNSGLLLCKQLQIPSNENNNSIVEKFWKNRPFQYSSAINIHVAKIVLDMLYDITVCSLDTKKDTLTLLDPTCGSGTFLAYGLEIGLSVNGHDINHRCVEGSRDNINFLFPSAAAQCDISQMDFSILSSMQDNFHDICVANLPWGQNTEIFDEDCNSRILQNIYSSLIPNGYAVIISKCNVKMDLSSCGFFHLGSVSIPPRGFVLPDDKKNGSKTKQRTNGSSNCIVTVVQKC